MDAYDLHELQTTGSYYTWTNRTVWSRLDRALMNAYWYAEFDFTHAQNLPMVLSDHTPLILRFVDTPRTKPSFQFCEMWSYQPEFQVIVANFIPSWGVVSLDDLCLYLDQVKQ